MVVVTLLFIFSRQIFYISHDIFISTLGCDIKTLPVLLLQHLSQTEQPNVAPVRQKVI